VSAAIQLRIDDATGYGLPLRPEALAELSEFERAHIFGSIGLDPEQRQCAEAAIEAVQAGRYLVAIQEAA
jgi:hypothetical protein